MTGIEEDSDKSQDDDLQLNPKEILKYSQKIDNKLCCPEIVSVHCRRIIEVTENTKVSKCPEWNHTISVSKCERKFEGSLEVGKGNMLENFDIFYNCERCITKMVNRNKEEMNNELLTNMITYDQNKDKMSEGKMN